MVIDSDIHALEARRERLRQDIGRQQKLLAEIRERVVTARRDRLAELAESFDRQLASLSPWIRESRAGAIRRLRARLPEMAERGERIDVAALVKDAPIER